MRGTVHRVFVVASERRHVRDSQATDDSPMSSPTEPVEYRDGVAHGRRDFEFEHELIDQKVTQLFSLVAEGVAGTTDALLAGDVASARALISRDRQVDDLYRDIEAIVQRRFALQTPLANDLRYFLTVLRIVPELERSGDLVEHIAQRAARNLGADLSPRLRGLLERMGGVTAEMWRTAALAYASRDGHAVDRLRTRDDELDSLHVSLMTDIATAGLPMTVAIDLVLVGRFYERLGDHAVNVSNRVHYLAFGSPAPPENSANAPGESF